MSALGGEFRLAIIWLKPSGRPWLHLKFATKGQSIVRYKATGTA
jgi:hypothetical protein